MKGNKPTELGLYWVRSEGCRWWNGIAEISGEVPFLKISTYAYFTDSICNPSNIFEFGDKIEQKKVILRQGEKV